MLLSLCGLATCLALLLSAVGCSASSDHGAATAPGASGAPGTPGTSLPASWVRTTVDGFGSTTPGAPPDPGVWDLSQRLDNGGDWNSGTREIEAYTTSTANARQTGDGRLQLTVQQNTDPALKCAHTPDPNGTCAYTSAFLVSRKPVLFQPYGRIEARIQLPGGVGLLPAFWAVGGADPTHPALAWPNNEEIDVMESTEVDSRGRSAPNQCLVCGGLHGPDRRFPDSAYKDWISGDSVPLFSGNPSFSDLGAMAELSGHAHVYAADWYPDRVEFSIDGRVYNVVRRSEAPEGSWVFDRPFYLMLDIAVVNRAGGPPASTAFPRSMYVDYVNVYTPRGRVPEAGHLTSPVAGGSCVEPVDATGGNGTRLRLASCRGKYAGAGHRSTDNAAQYWSVLDDGTVRSSLGSTKCLDVTWSGTAGGTPVQLYDCNGSGAQQWIADPVGRLVNKQSGKCLANRGGKVADGTPLEIDTCSDAPSEIYALPVQKAAEWPLNDRSVAAAGTIGAPAFDSTGGGRSAACGNGVGWVQDPARNWVARFDGHAGSCTTAGQITGGTGGTGSTGSLTVAAWVRPDALDGTGDETAVSQGGNPDSGFRLGYDRTLRRWYFTVPDSAAIAPAGTVTGFTSVTSAGAATGKWTDVVGVLDAAHRVISLYVDGQLQGSAQLGGPAGQASGPLVIGGAVRTGRNTEFLRGLVSDVRVWDSALSATTVHALHATDLAKPDPAAVQR